MVRIKGDESETDVNIRLLVRADLLGLLLCWINLRVYDLKVF